MALMEMDYEQRVLHAAEYLKRTDAVLAPVIDSYSACTIVPHRDYYRSLVESIIGQQLSIKAAATIRQRCLDFYQDTFPTPEQIIATPSDDLRSVGLSGAKTRYVKDLAEHVIDGRIHFDDIDTMTNDEIIAQLTQVKGIGEWTVHMFLIFCVGRQDVLAHGDLGIRMGIKRLYGLDDLPTPTEVIRLAAARKWAPYESVACWYIWRSLENN